MRRLFLSLALIASAAAHAAQQLPAEFEFNRIHLVAQAPDGSPFEAYVDSGGSWNLIAPEVAQRLRLASAGAPLNDEVTGSMVAFPPFLVKAGVPPPLRDPVFGGNLLLGSAPVADSELFLGGPWFAGRVWRIDYLRHELSVEPFWRPTARDHALPMGFKRNDAGVRSIWLPRIEVAIDGEALDMLLDTGAMARLADDAAPAFHVEPGTVVGASFISQTLFDRWRAKHPEWRVADKGEALQGHLVPMIEVPHVGVGGFTVGPVWFAMRRDLNFTQGLSQMMDKPVVGAFGGSGLHYFHLVLDYPHATAWIRPNQ